MLTLGIALLWSAMIQPDPTPAPPPLPQSPPPLPLAPPPPTSPNSPCGFDFTDDDRTLLKGAIENQWCYNIGVPSSAIYDPVNAAECKSFYIDPIVEPEDPANYAFDCSSGCQACAYNKGSDGSYRCKKQQCWQTFSSSILPCGSDSALCVHRAEY
jgi:hypothetical protein